MFEVRCLSERRHAARLSVLLTLALVIDPVSPAGIACRFLPC
jgi:hypothetical protein